MQYRYLETPESRSCRSISDPSRDDAGREWGATGGNSFEGHDNTMTSLETLRRAVWRQGWHELP